MIERAYPEGTPVAQPVRSVTSFSESLACMDDMLDKLGRPTVLITTKQFPDASNKSGTAVRELVITALSEMSRKSNAFRFIDFEVDLTRQDTVQYLSSLMLGMNTLDSSPPDIYVSGALSYIDQNILARRRGLGVSADGRIKGKELGFDLGYDGDINTSVIALEMHLGDMKTLVVSWHSRQQFSPGCQGRWSGRRRRHHEAGRAVQFKPRPQSGHGHCSAHTG